MQDRSNNRVALVTGSGRRRVGNTVARMLAERGYAVALHYHSSVGEAEETVAELRTKDAWVEAFQADLTVEAEVDRLFQAVHQEFGRLDVLVTAASLWKPKSLESVTADDVRRHFETDVLGTFLCCQRAGRIMVEQSEGGVIVTIGDWAVQRPYPGYAAYLVAKGSVPTMTRVMAVELARRNPAVRVNCILPGPVMFPADLSEEEKNQSIAGTLVRREGRPEHIGQTVLFFIENDFVTGACLPVDGGRSIAGGEGGQTGLPPHGLA